MAVTRVIIADPCPDNRDSLAELLRLCGFAAETADSLDAVLARLLAAPADAVVTEGFGDLARTCRAIRAAAPGVPVAFHTTRGEPADVRLARALGCWHFLKAASTEDLLGWLAGWPSAGGCGAADDGWRGDYPGELVSDPCLPRRRPQRSYGRRLHHVAVVPAAV
jgi:CheY-like chemotaxis protein